MALIETLGMLLRSVESDQGPICLAEAALSQVRILNPGRRSERLPQGGRGEGNAAFIPPFP